MTRREFFQSVFKTAAAITIGAFVLTEKVLPRGFIRAIRHNKYPGSLKQLPNIFTQGKWRG